MKFECETINFRINEGDWGLSIQSKKPSEAILLTNNLDVFDWDVTTHPHEFDDVIIVSRYRVISKQMTEHPLAETSDEKLVAFHAMLAIAQAATEMTKENSITFLAHIHDWLEVW